MHAEFLCRVHKEWEERFTGSEHDGLSTTPAYLIEEAERRNAPTVVDAKSDTAMHDLRRDVQKPLNFGHVGYPTVVQSSASDGEHNRPARKHRCVDHCKNQSLVQRFFEAWLDRAQLSWIKPT